jgi:hypothetical protein
LDEIQQRLLCYDFEADPYWEKLPAVRYDSETDVSEFTWHGAPYFDELLCFAQAGDPLLISATKLVVCMRGAFEPHKRMANLGMPLEIWKTPFNECNQGCSPSMAEYWRLEVVTKRRGKRGKFRIEPHYDMAEYKKATYFFPKQEEIDKWADLFDNRLCGCNCLKNVSLLLQEDEYEIEQALYQAVKSQKIRDMVCCFENHKVYEFFFEMLAAGETLEKLLPPSERLELQKSIKETAEFLA